MSAGYLRKCAGKRRHATKQEAENHRRQMVRSGRWRLDRSNTYWCNQCGSFHAGRIGSSNRGKR